MSDATQWLVQCFNKNVNSLIEDTRRFGGANLVMFNSCTDEQLAYLSTCEKQRFSEFQCVSMKDDLAKGVIGQALEEIEQNRELCAITAYGDPDWLAWQVRHCPQMRR
jgi:hypothetical protein